MNKKFISSEIFQSGENTLGDKVDFNETGSHRRFEIQHPGDVSSLFKI